MLTRAVITDLRIAIVADVHCANHRTFGGPMVAGLNDRFRMCQRTLRGAIAAANNKQCTHFAVLGDLFDTVRPTPQMIGAVMRELGNFQGEVILVAGNHDKASEEPGDNSLVPFQDTCVVVDDEPLLLSDSRGAILFAPYRTGPAVGWIAEYTSMLPTNGGTLATHVGLITKDTPPWLRMASDAIPSEMFTELGAVGIIAGNWHAHMRLPTGEDIQVGALVPTGFDNPTTHPLAVNDPYGSVLVWRSTNPTTRLVVDGPRFLMRDFITQKDLLQYLHQTTAGGTSCACFLKIKADLAQLADAALALDEAKARGLIRDGFVEPSAQDKQRVAQATSKAVLNSSSLDEAVLHYLQKQDLPDGVLIPRVAERVRHYLRSGAKGGVLGG